MNVRITKKNICVTRKLSGTKKASVILGESVTENIGMTKIIRVTQKEPVI